VHNTAHIRLVVAIRLTRERDLRVVGAGTALQRNASPCAAVVVELGVVGLIEYTKHRGVSYEGSTRL